MTESVPNSDPGCALGDNDVHSPFDVWARMTETLPAGEDTP